MTTYYPYELKHYGVQGMKWGVRRYQNVDGSLTEEGRIHYGSNRDTKRYAKELNRIDKIVARDKRHYSEAEEKRERYKTKAGKTANLVKRDKLLEKSKIEGVKMETAKANIDKAKAETDALIKEAQDKGYTVRSKEVQRSAVEGRDFAKSLLLTTGALTVALATGSPYTLLSVPTNTVTGTNYKVNTTGSTANQAKARSNTKELEDRLYGKEHVVDIATKGNTKSGGLYEKGFTKSQKEDNMRLAVNEGRYNIDFLEAIQNSEIAYKEDYDAINKEYKKFLDDPNDYWENGWKKLKQA